MIEIERRYQYYLRSGITWTNWFTYTKCDNITEAEEKLKELKKRKELVKKLKGEYRIKEEKE